MEKKVVRKVARLFFVHPTDKPINENGGKYDAPRRGRPHKGLDFLAPKGADVKASEGGVVVKSGNKPYVPGGDNNYGETIVIDHTPGVPEDQRHIYTLYAHLDKRLVFKGRKVRQGETIGKSGNSGMKAFYEGKNSGFHLHFEVRDSETKMDWDIGWPIKGNHKNPIGYLCETKTFEYESLEEERMGFPKAWF